MIKTIALMLTVWITACSSFGVRGPGSTFEEIQNCTDSYYVPIRDSVAAGLFTAGSVGLLVAGANGSGCGSENVDDHGYGFNACIDTNTLAVVGGVLLAIPAFVTALSSIRSFEKVTKCRRANEQWREQNRTSQLINHAIHS